MKILLMICVLTLSAGWAPAADGPIREILGLKLSMTKEAARERLGKIGSHLRDEAEWQEVWKIRDASYSHVIVGFGKDEKLNYITAVVREDKDAKPLSYAKIGDLQEAQQAGDVKIKNFKYQWERAAEGGKPRMRVTAAGRDPKNLTTASLQNLENEPAKNERD